MQQNGLVFSFASGRLLRLAGLAALAAAGVVRAQSLSTALNGAMTWTTGGDAGWCAQTNRHSGDGLAGQSGEIGDDGCSWVRTVVTGPGVMGFDWSVSSEEDYDFLSFYIDGVERACLSGDIGWHSRTFPVVSGVHTALWGYAKDESANGYADAGWLDAVQFGPGFVCGVESTNVAESGAALQILVRRIGPGAGAVAVSYATSNGTAEAGTDYIATNGALSFASGETARTVRVSLLANAPVEGEEVFFLRFGNPTAGWRAPPAVEIRLVDQPPALVCEPWTYNDPVYAGDSADLEVEAAGPAPVFEWYQGVAGDSGHPLAALRQYEDYETGNQISVVAVDDFSAGTDFWVRVWNAAGAVTSDTTSITLLPQATPLITAQPQDSTVSVGEAVSAHVGARGGGLSFQWYGGAAGDTSTPVSAMSGERDSWMVFWPDAPGTTCFWVRVWNVMGAATGRTVTVTCTGQTAPAIATEPADVAAYVGESCQIGVGATGGALSYQWYGGIVGDASAPVAAAEGGIGPDIFFNASFAGTTSFWVHVWNDVGSATSRTATVTLLPLAAPEIAREPYDRTAFVGDVLWIGVQATGGALSYQWYGGAARDPSAPVSPAACGDDSYMRFDVSMPGTTSFWVRAWNGLGSATSCTMTVTVLPQSAPAIDGETEDFTAYVGDPCWIGVHSTGGGLSHQWYGGMAGDPSAPVSPAEQGDLATMSFSPSAPGATSFWVHAWNSLGSATSRTVSIAILPRSAPHIGGEPSDAIAYAGDDVWVMVQAGGGGLSHQWYGGAAGDPSAPVSPAADGDSSVMWFSASAPGTTSFWVHAWNSLGSATSRTATITVLPQTMPEIHGHPQDRTAGIGDAVWIDVQAAGGGLSYQWYGGPVGDASAPVSASADGDSWRMRFSASSPVTTSFWVRVSNGLGAVTSRTVAVTIADGTAPIPAPVIAAMEPADGGWRILWPSQPGVHYEVLRSAEAASCTSGVPEGTAQAGTGGVLSRDVLASPSERRGFFVLRAYRP